MITLSQYIRLLMALIITITSLSEVAVGKNILLTSLFYFELSANLRKTLIRVVPSNRASGLKGILRPIQLT